VFCPRHRDTIIPQTIPQEMREIKQFESFNALHVPSYVDGRILLMLEIQKRPKKKELFLSCDTILR